MNKFSHPFAVLSSLFIVLLANAAPAQESEVSSLTSGVGACPTPITIELRDSWLDAYESSDAIRRLRSNPARKAIVATVLVSDRLPGASISVMSLGSVDAAQGRITPELFEHLKKTTLHQAREPDESLSAALQKRVEELSEKGGIEVSEFKVFQNVITSPGQFVFFGRSTSADESFHTAGVFRHINSCLINLSVGIPENSGPSALFETLRSLKVRG